MSLIIKLTDEGEPLTKMEKKPFGKARKDRNLEFAIDVVAQPTPEGFHTKKAEVSSNLPGWSTWEINCDEGTGGQGLGLDSAPSPMAYMSAGIAMCLITHIKGIARQMKIEIDDIRVEQRISFSSTIDFKRAGESVHGYNDGIETHVMISSPGAKEEVEAFMQIANDACLGLQSLINAVPSSTTLYINE